MGLWYHYIINAILSCLTFTKIYEQNFWMSLILNDNCFAGFGFAIFYDIKKAIRKEVVMPGPFYLAMPLLLFFGIYMVSAQFILFTILQQQ